MEDTSKRCIHCGTDRSATNFNKSSKTKDGLSSWCRQCQSIKHREYYIQHSETIRQHVKAFHECHRDEILASCAERYRQKKLRGWKAGRMDAVAVCPTCGFTRAVKVAECKDKARHVERQCRPCARLGNTLTRVAPPELIALGSVYQPFKLASKVYCIIKLGSRCELCGYPFDGENTYAFDFDHKDSTNKEFVIGKGRQAWQSILDEAEKCRLLCAICHRKRHANDGTLTPDPCMVEVYKLAAVEC